MPKNKDALIRYRIINRCLVENEFASREELKAACERALDIYPIGMRTIEADIHAMRYDSKLAYHAPIRFNKLKKAYYYEDSNYSIDNVPLNEEELDSLKFAARLLEQFSDVEIFKTFTGSVQKIIETLNAYRNYDEDTFRDFIDFEKVDKVKGTEFIDPLIEALRNKTVVNIEYMTFWSAEKKTHVVHPYLLKEYRNRWYLVGYHNKYKDIRTYGLDRIISLHEMPGIRFFDSGFDAKEYYKNVIGVSILDNRPVEVHLAFTPFQAQYVITQPLHHSQKLVSQNKNRVVFSYFVVPNYELISQILAWGNEVEVLKPEEIIREVNRLSG